MNNMVLYMAPGGARVTVCYGLMHVLIFDC